MSTKFWHADFMHTFSMRCKVCIESPTSASKPNRNLGIRHDASAQSAYRLCPGRAPAPAPPGLDSRLHPALGDVGRDGAAPAHGPVGARGNSFCRVSSASLLLVSSLFTSGVFRAFNFIIWLDKYYDYYVHYFTIFHY
jgi:hypothetical protein